MRKESQYSEKYGKGGIYTHTKEDLRNYLIHHFKSPTRVLYCSKEPTLARVASSVNT